MRCGKLLDVRSGKLLTNQVIVFDGGGNITAVGPADSPLAPGGVTAVDLPSATCLPGLIDVHTHLTGDPISSGYQGLGISIPSEAITGVKNARLTLLAGFTAVRNVGAGNYTDVALRDAINAGEVDGPRMLVSGPRWASPAATVTIIFCLSNFTTRRVESPMVLGPRAPKSAKP